MNVLMNFVLMMLFVVLNNWALQGGLEETFVFLAIIYGILVVVMNAVYVAKVAKR